MYNDESDWDDDNYAINNLKRKASNILECKRIKFQEEKHYNDLVKFYIMDLRSCIERHENYNIRQRCEEIICFMRRVAEYNNSKYELRIAALDRFQYKIHKIVVEHEVNILIDVLLDQNSPYIDDVFHEIFIKYDEFDIETLSSYL